MRTIAVCAIATLSAALLPGHSALAGQSRPVVLELFTSEGCNSCPPADEILSDLADNHGDLLPLAFHVTYWNRLGWPDPFSFDGATKRQEQYAATMGPGSIYTPQMVVDGVHDVVGSDRSGILSAVAAQKWQAATAAVPLTLARSAGGVTVTVGAGKPEAANVLVAGFDSRHVTSVKHGENAGHTLAESNIVRGLVRAGDWHGAGETLHASLPDGEHLAALLQAPDGRILGAARLD